MGERYGILRSLLRHKAPWKLLLFVALVGGLIYIQTAPSRSSDSAPADLVRIARASTLLAHGGPDSYGYTLIDSVEPGGPYYLWEDIRGTGTPLSLGNNGISGPLPIGFPFNYYGADYSQVYVDANGWLTLASGQSSNWVAEQLPNPTTPQGTVAGWWYDLNPAASASSSIHYGTVGTAPNRRFIVQFTLVFPYSQWWSRLRPSTFEFKLFEGTNVIEIHYAVTGRADGPQRHSAGIENEAGSTGLNYFYGTGGLPNPRAVRYDPPADVMITKNVTPSLAGPGATLTYTLEFSNVGPGVASGLTIDDMVPISVTNTSVVSSSDALITQRAGTRYVWDVGDLAYKEGGTITITGVLSDPLASGIFSNTARGFLPAVEVGTLNNRDTAGLMVDNYPIASAGTDQDVSRNVLVTLDGSGSGDPDGDMPLSYGWAQRGGTPVILSSAIISQPTFTAPGDLDVLTFTLAVTDSWGLADPTPDEVVVTVGNQPPIADAGTDQSVNRNALVMLDGSGSGDPDNDLPLTYLWMQTGGTPVSLSSATIVYPAFIAPAGPGVLTFTLAVSDSLGLADPTPDEVVVTVNNQPPLADAGSDQSVDTDAPVTLDGSGSSDPDNDLPLTYGWLQTGGTPVLLSSNTLSQPTFTTPGDPDVLTFTLAVTDSLGLADPTPAEVVVTVNNQLPLADAGGDQRAGVSAPVRLDGSGSSDPDNDLPLTYGWLQTGGTSVILSSATISQPMFTAPGDLAVLTFTLVVTDSLGLASTPDEVVIDVKYRIYLPLVLRNN
jgi:uncharacterized repeat protein (TIGR01451 family)